jgi:hypothetical protein
METIRTVDYFKIKAANKPGEGARILGVLRRAGVNLLSFSGFPRGGKAQLDFIPESSSAFLAAMAGAGIKTGSPKKGFLVQGEDRVGAVADLMMKLGQAKINVTAIDAVSSGEGRYGAILWVKPASVEKAATLLGAL